MSVGAARPRWSWEAPDYDRGFWDEQRGMWVDDDPPSDEFMAFLAYHDRGEEPPENETWFFLQTLLVRHRWTTLTKHVRDGLAAKLAERDGPGCRGCGTELGLTIDHIVPIRLGGSNDTDNLQILCRPCNSRKGMRR